MSGDGSGYYQNQDNNGYQSYTNSQSQRYGQAPNTQNGSLTQNVSRSSGQNDGYQQQQQQQADFRSNTPSQIWYSNNAVSNAQEAAGTLSALGTTSNHSRIPPQTSSQRATQHNYPTTTTGPSYNMQYATSSSTTLNSQNQELPAQYASTSLRPSHHAERAQTANSSTHQHTYQQNELARVASPAQKQASRHLQNLQSGASSSCSYENTTIDRSQVYDAWPEVQRKLGKQRAEAEQRERERAAEKQLKQEARKAEEERARQVAELKAAEVKERKKKEAAEKAKARRAAKKAVQGTPPPPADMDDPEKKIRDMMAQIREMNNMHPDLLQKIWEQERTSYQQGQTPKPATPTAAPIAPVVSSSKSGSSKRASVKASSHIPPAPVALPSPVPVVVSGPTPAPARKTIKAMIWPKEKKAIVADFAVPWLKSFPENANIEINLKTIFDILDTNPTYVDLCEALERQGIKLDRASMAKALMSTNPEINSRAKRPSESRTAVEPNVGRKVDPRPSISAPSPAASMPTMSTVNYTTPQGFSAHAYRDDDDDPMPLMDNDDDMPDVKPTPTPWEPVSKADAARKRGLADLVDLAAMSDEDVPPPKRIIVPQPGHDDSGSDAPRAPVVPTPIQFPSQQRYAQALEERCRNVLLIQPLDRKKVLRRDRYNPTTIARDILLASGKHPNMPGLNAHLEILKTTLARFGAPGFRADNNSDLATIRWDILDPGDPIPQAKPQKIARDLAYDSDGDDEAENIQPMPMRTTPASGGGGLATIHPAVITPTFKRPKGRPPGVKNKSLIVRTHSGTGPTPGGPADRPPPSTSKSSSKPSMSYAQLRQAQAAPGIQGNRRGRPVGWRKHMHQKGIGTSPLAGPTPGGPASSKLRKSKTAPDELKIQPKYPVFDCKWKDCHAKLHNLETLRKHVLKLHGKTDKGGRYVCQWAGCGREFREMNKATGKVEKKVREQSFDDVSAWTDHVEESHITPISWQLGDGPAGGFSDAESSEAFLSDAQGTPVTPRARLPAGLNSVADMSVAQAQGELRVAAHKSTTKAEMEALLHRARARGRNKEGDGVEDTEMQD